MTKQYPSKQYLSEVISNREFAEGVPPEIVIAMARQLLAGLEQEPVGYFYEDGPKNWYQIMDGDSVPPNMRRPLYAAPQLPQPAVVPSNELLSAMEEVLRISDRDHEAWHRVRKGIADFRAAMLQGAEPVQRWIPCIERMPGKLLPVMVMYEDGEMWSAIWTGTKWDDGTEVPDPHAVTHWQEMPAAPQQEA